MSLVANDPFQFFWNMNPVAVFATTIVVEPVMLWIIELYRNFKDRHEKSRPPWGLAIFRWRAVYLGDPICLSSALAFISVYYRRMQVNPSFLTSREFYLVPFVFGLMVTVGFLVSEESAGSYPHEKKVNLNRVYHSLYFWWMSYMLSGFFIRWWAYWEQTGLLILVAVLLAGWAWCIYRDGVTPNAVWKHITRKYPKRIEYL